MPLDLDSIDAMIEEVVKPKPGVSFARPGQPPPASAANPAPKPVSFMGPRATPQDVPQPEQPFGAGPSGGGVSFAQPQPSKPSGNPADPSVKGAPSVSFAKRYEDAQNKVTEAESDKGPQLTGWKKWLDIAGRLTLPGVEKAIPGTPGHFASVDRPRNIEAAKSAAEGIAKEATIANTESQARERDALTQKALTPPAEKPEDVVKQFSDALASGDMAKAEELKPRVREFLDTTQKPPVETGKDKDISDYIEAHKLQDTAANREKARGAIANRSKPAPVSQNDARDIAEAIRRGDQPPTTTGLYRNAAPVRAELARSGFNLAQAESDWHATQKHLATLNGAQQERLRQAVTFTSDSLSIIDDLYNQWQKVGKTSGWKTFNKASLATAKQLPGEAGNIANRLEAQISDLTAELGTVYKGGNSSTDESLKLAANNLKAEWNEKTFKDALAQVRQNLEIRKNSIRHSEAAGVSSNSPYTPAEQRTQGSGSGKVLVEGKDF